MLMLEILNVTYNNDNLERISCDPQCSPNTSCSPDRGCLPVDGCIPKRSIPVLRAGCNPDSCTPDCDCRPSLDDCKPVWD